VEQIATCHPERSPVPTGTGEIPTTKDPRPQHLSAAMAGAAHREEQSAND